MTEKDFNFEVMETRNFGNKCVALFVEETLANHFAQLYNMVATEMEDAIKYTVVKLPWAIQ